MKRIFSLLLSIALLIGMAGAGIAEGSLEMSDIPGLTAPGVLPITTDEDVVITIGHPQDPRITDYYDNVYTKLIEEETGVKLEFTFFPNDGVEARRNLELMVSANQTLPDLLIGFGLTGTARENYGNQGVLVDVLPYIGEYTYYWEIARDKWCDPSEQENLIKLGLTSNGNLYGFPVYYGDPTDPQAWAAWINKSWLEALDMEMPVTTDDFYDVLVAFRDMDPNGNGQNDEIALIGSKGWVSNPVTLLMNAFIYYNPSYMFNVEDGTLFPSFTQDEFREGLRYIRKLVEDKLLSELSFTQEAADERAMTDLSEDQDSYIGAFVAHPHLMFNSTNPHRSEYTYVPPLTGPEGISYVPKDIPMSQYGILITRDCENVELAIRFCDALCKENISMTRRFGPEGEEWYIVEDQSAVTATYAAMGYEPYYFTYNSLINSTAHNGHWGNNWSTMMIPPKMFGSTVARTADDYENEYAQYFAENWSESVASRVDKNPDELVPRLNYTSEESAAVVEIKTAIDTYVQEAATLFATGVLDIEADWDDYLAELEVMGLQTYLEISQQCYDRMNSF